MNTWLLFNYKVPNEPSARRVYVWRKLKALGALLLHDSVWVLPMSARTQEKLQWLASEVQDMGGEAMLWEAQQLLTGQEIDLVRQFQKQVEALYLKILQHLKEPEPDLTLLSREYQQASAQDYFQSEMGQHVRRQLLEKRKESKA